MTNQLNQRLMKGWLAAAEDLNIRVIAPYVLQSSSGEPVPCEVFLPDFGSPSGGVIVSAKTERRIRGMLRSVKGHWVSIEPDRAGHEYDRRYVVALLEDFGWFGPASDRPAWWRSDA